MTVQGKSSGGPIPGLDVNKFKRDAESSVFEIALSRKLILLLTAIQTFAYNDLQIAWRQDT